MIVSRLRQDPNTRWFLAAVALAGLIYVSFGWTPSSYGLVLQQIQAPDAGPVFGVPRVIRADEWAIATPFFQAAVRNRFQRVNETSFYREDLRNFYTLPLADWSLVFKPQVWAFFLVPPATAFSIYYALFMCGFLAGYQLLFQRLGVASWLAAAAAFMMYFSGLTQFWWTTFAPLLAGLSWILLIVLASIAWWKKALVCAWAFPALVLSFTYPVLLLTSAWGALVLILAFRRPLLRSPGDLAAIAAGTLSTAVVLYAYYGNLIPIMRHTVYPGLRIGSSGGTPIEVALSEIFPFLTFRLSDYQNLTGQNICEIGAIGSFLPLLTLCLTRYRSLRDLPAIRNALLILLAGFTAFTLWEIAPVPAWIGRILFWDRSVSQRCLFASGLLLTLASLLIWSRDLISLHPFRIALFMLLGPVASLLLKIAWLMHQGGTAEGAFSGSLDDVFLCGLLLAAGIAACYVPAVARAPILVIAITLMNVYAFAGFNPVQPAGPIFEVPDTPVVRELRKQAAASPDGVLVDPRFLGATLNGLGFRSVAHAQMAPNLALFHRYFPAMDPERFNLIFNRYGYISLTANAMPDLSDTVVIEMPIEVFVPVRNVRKLVLAPAQPRACSEPPAGGIGQVSLTDHTLTIEGWAPWPAETGAQGIRVLSARPLVPESLSTTTRPDIAEQLQDYRFVKSGFKLRISSADGKPLRPKDLVLLAFGTSQGEIRLACCGCP